jgi:ribulose-bisphosphate carboxylase large chain
MKFFNSSENINLEQYFVATYDLQSKTNLRDAAWSLAIGQSVGNPGLRNNWETDALFEAHSCIVLDDEVLLNNKSNGRVSIAFPIANTDWETDGISHMLCQLMGGHVDIDIFLKCRLINLELPIEVQRYFLKPKFGLSGFRKITGQYGKPLLGSIVKPKIGISPEVMIEMIREMVDGGVDFIKEDEIMSNPACAPLERRVDLVANFLAKQSRKIIFCHTINCDSHVVTNRVNRVHELGGNGVHINVFSGLGVYNSIRKLNLPIFLHFQSSGVKLLTDATHRFSISWPVVCQLATLMGVDSIQTGMIGGYSNDDPNEVAHCIRILQEGNSVPALSCGMHPGLINFVVDSVGKDVLVNAGGAVHGHSGGTIAGAKAMRQAIDGTFGKEYEDAILKWGIK